MIRHHFLYCGGLTSRSATHRTPHPSLSQQALGRFPSREFALNQVWLLLAQIAADLTAWTRLPALTGDAKILAACEPKALRYRLWHVPARLTHGARRRRLRIPESWPWAAAIVAVFSNFAAIPQPA